MAAQLRKKDSVHAAYVVEIECYWKQVYLARAALQVLNAIMLRKWSVLPAGQNPNLCEIRLVFSNFEIDSTTIRATESSSCGENKNAR